ncbi:MAG: glycosyltransferase, partial [Rhodobacteraceae bacterium]|nr:glycosyltransferase [Paracoccaceae bacterium]
PGQLLEAWAAFRDGDDRLGCLQAPLAIANLRANWIAGLFALEYSGLFRILIPFLARIRMPIPLGGTSNHFRRSALEAAGGWDPHNVTEDADLGMRLYAHGYRTGTLSRATIESAPVSLGIWIRQRTRWLKGWAQTWLVAMRRPARTCRALGPGGFVVFQLLIAGMLVSALAHP